MEKWTEQRITAYKRYVENNDKQIMKLENEYAETQKLLRQKIERIESEKRDKESHLKYLYDQGWMLCDGNWIENQRAASKS